MKLWGHPTTFGDVYTLFSKFCLGELSALPWSDQAVASETSIIAKQLAQINELGFLTINSQPAVNGVRSDHKKFGWGPANGYVYQKAYLEFFVNPTLLTHLLSHIERDSNITYYVINKRGDLRTNTHSDGPNAVTWGVFPGKEIVQPTIVEAISFMAWKVRKDLESWIDQCSEQLFVGRSIRARCTMGQTLRTRFRFSKVDQPADGNIFPCQCCSQRFSFLRRHL